MSEKQPGVILESIRGAYAQQFGQKVDERLLQYVIQKEIQKKREAFLQVQISMAGVGLQGLLQLRSHLKGEVPEAGEKPAFEKLPVRHSKDVLQNSVRKRAKEALELSLERANPDEYANLSEDEVQKQKRRAYARAYYHRKKKEQEAHSEKPSVKKFKTTPEQRAYQRAYYKRKKEEGGSVQEDINDFHRSPAPESKDRSPSEEIFNGRSLFKSDSSGLVDKRSVDYDSMASDRMAIENAFRAEDLKESLEPSPRGRKLSDEGNGFSAAGFYATKTKLRKAKHSLTT